jgi:hypothetical protein
MLLEDRERLAFVSVSRARRERGVMRTDGARLNVGALQCSH